MRSRDAADAVGGGDYNWRAGETGGGLCAAVESLRSRLAVKSETGGCCCTDADEVTP